MSFNVEEEKRVVAERFPWAPQVLRPYESGAAMLAKLAFLSFQPTPEFLKEFSLRFDAGYDQVPLVDARRFNKEEFLKLTHEQPRRLWLQSVANLKFPKTILGIPIDTLEYQKLFICEECFQAGYHSNLHQFRWLDRCFVHGTALKPIQRIKHHLIGDCDWAKVLRERWFKPFAPWQNSRDPLEWGPIDRAPYLRVVPELARLLRHTATWTRSAGVRLEDWVDRSANPATTLSLIVQASLEGARWPSPRVAHLLHLDEPGFRKLFIAPRAAKTLIALPPWELEAVAMKRFEASLAKASAPAWLGELREFVRHETSGHEPCFALLSESIRRWHSVWPVRQDPGRSVAILLQLLGQGVETCPAVRLVEAMSMFRSGPQFKVARARRPWFHLSSLRAAVGPWLTRSLRMTKEGEVPTAPAVLSLLDVIISIWVGQTLLEATQARVRPVDARKMDKMAISNAGAGQATHPAELRRPLLGDCTSQIKLIEQSGQHYALFRSPLARAAVGVVVPNHWDMVFEAVCTAEAASQHRWPTDRHTRCSAPSAAMSARVNMILQRWSSASSA